MPGPGHGYVDVFDTDGHLLQHFAQGGFLDSPWGIALAPQGFGALADRILIGNFGSGAVNAYDLTGKFVAPVADKAGRPIPNFGQQWDQWVTEARRIAPHEDAERFATRMLNVNAKTVRFDQPRIDVQRDGDEYLTLYTTEDLPDRVIDRNKSLPGALGNAYERVKEILSGYTQIGGPPPPRPKNGNGNGQSNGHKPGPNANGSAANGEAKTGRRKWRGRRCRNKPASK